MYSLIEDNSLNFNSGVQKELTESKKNTASIDKLIKKPKKKDIVVNEDESTIGINKTNVSSKINGRRLDLIIEKKIEQLLIPLLEQKIDKILNDYLSLV